jgi:5-(carboxyamino)imidazole ribonucleotide synthase
MIVGIVGGGQLARMLALAGYPLGLRFVVLDPDPQACAGQVAELIQGEYDDPVKLDLLAQQADVITFDFENVPVDTARSLEQQRPFFPPPAALATAQDRLHEKTLFQRLGIPTPKFCSVDTLDDLRKAVQHIGLPALLKTRRFGYDGKGQCLLRSKSDVEVAWRTLGDTPLILEGFVSFQREVSLLAVRNTQHQTAFYPLVENRHRDGILRLSFAPEQTPDLARQAHHYVTKIMQQLDYVGILAVEFFQCDGQLVANEMAPRVHNSGHWTIEGAEVSQFENHLRAILGLPLGSTAATGFSAMVNCIGTLPDDYDNLLAVPGAHLHVYGKSPRPGRKVGHFTLRSTTENDRQSSLKAVLPLLDREAISD